MNTNQIIKNYATQIAGRMWTFPQIEVISDPTGRRCIRIEDTEKMNKAVALEICGETESLALEEFEFLVDLTNSKNNEIAAVIFSEPSTISNWRKRRIQKLPQLESNVLRKYFWGKIFGSTIEQEKLNCIMFIQREIIHLKQETESLSDYKVLKVAS